MTKKMTVSLISIAIIAFLLTFITGAINTVPYTGVRDFAVQQFHSTDAAIGYSFALFQVGYFVGVVLNGLLFKILKTKLEIFITMAIYVIVSLFLYAISSNFELSVMLLIMGFGIGMAYTIPNYLIVNSFEGRTRSSILNVGDFFFSVGSFVIPVVAAFVFAHNLSWQLVYASLFVAFAVVIILTCIAKFPKTGRELKLEQNSKIIAYSKWNKSIYLMLIMIFFYLVSYMGFNYWTFNDMTVNFHSSIPEATSGIMYFWIFYAVGCAISSVALKFVRIHKYLIGSFILTIIAFILILNAGSATTFCIYISILGLGCATIFSSSLSYTTLLIEKPSPMLISTFIAVCTIGSIAAQFGTSYIQEVYGLNAVTIVSLIVMVISTLLFISVALNKKNNPA